jgi:uncharacterized membrane protein
MNSVPGSFWEWTAMLTSGERTGLLVLCVFAVVTVIVIVAVTIYSMHKNRLDDSLKRELLERGMSADEIATVMNKSVSKRGSQKSTSA